MYYMIVLLLLYIDFILSRHTRHTRHREEERRGNTSKSPFKDAKFSMTTSMTTHDYFTKKSKGKTKGKKRGYSTQGSQGKGINAHTGA
jgi:hypothetical protein